jgi:hypothetical protein
MLFKPKHGKYCSECGSKYNNDSPSCKCKKNFVVIESCPFCGFLPVIDRPYHDYNPKTKIHSMRRYYVSCCHDKGRCPVTGVVVWSIGRTLKAAVRKWNKRRSGG